jgi:hypothetical protein
LFEKENSFRLPRYALLDANNASLLTKASDRHNYRVLEGATAATCFAAIVTYLEDYSQSQLGVFIMGNSKRNVSEEVCRAPGRALGRPQILVMYAVSSKIQ